MTNTAIIITVICVVYMFLNIVISLYVSKIQAKKDASDGKGFLVSYFMGGRSMGGFVLAMTIMATFISASTFMGGAGMANLRGLSWVYLAIIQVPTAFLLLALLGKKFAILGRKTNAVTVIDLLDARYESKAVSIISSVSLVLFSVAIMVAQYIGGAIIFETITGLPYITGLLIFGVSVLIYTAWGGFKAVVTTDVIQGSLMVAGVVLILWTVISQGGGVEAITARVGEINPYWNVPNPPAVQPPFLLSLWILVGIATIGLPQTAVRGMAFKDTKSMHRSMTYSTCMFAFIMLGINLAGVFSSVMVNPADLVTFDYTLPALALAAMPLILAALFIACILSVVMSTVSSLLIMASSSIVKDLYVKHIAKDKEIEVGSVREKSIKTISLVITAILGVIVILLTVNPPDLIVWVNLFAFGGLQCAFLFPIVFGLFWKKANAMGSIFSAVAGVGVFMLSQSFALGPITYFGFAVNPIVHSLIIGAIAFLIGNMFGKDSPQKALDIFFKE